MMTNEQSLGKVKGIGVNKSFSIFNSNFDSVSPYNLVCKEEAKTYFTIEFSVLLYHVLVLLY